MELNEKLAQRRRELEEEKRIEGERNAEIQRHKYEAEKTEELNKLKTYKTEELNKLKTYGVNVAEVNFHTNLDEPLPTDYSYSSVNILEMVEHKNGEVVTTRLLVKKLKYLEIFGLLILLALMFVCISLEHYFVAFVMLISSYIFSKGMFLQELQEPIENIENCSNNIHAEIEK